jgi:ferredoxin
MKFLGITFMAVRWALTVAAILVFSWITAKIVRASDLPTPGEQPAGPTIDASACIGCGQCVRCAPSLFEMRNRKAMFKSTDGTLSVESLRVAAEACPVKAISLPETDAESGKETQTTL